MKHLKKPRRLFAELIRSCATEIRESIFINIFEIHVSTCQKLYIESVQFFQFWNMELKIRRCVVFCPTLLWNFTEPRWHDYLGQHGKVELAKPWMLKNEFQFQKVQLVRIVFELFCNFRVKKRISCLIKNRNT